MTQTLKSITGLGLLILAISCSTKQPENSNNDKPEHPSQETSRAEAFAKYLKSITPLRRPFTIDHLDYEKAGYDTALFRRYKHKSSRWPFGQILNDVEVVSTIEVITEEDTFKPVIMTYTKEGQKIDSLLPYKKTGWDVDYLSREYVTIKENNEIVVTDSTTIWKLDAGMDRIEDSKTTTTDTVIYKVDSSGKFVIVKGKVDK